MTSDAEIDNNENRRIHGPGRMQKICYTYENTILFDTKYKDTKFQILLASNVVSASSYSGVSFGIIKSGHILIVITFSTFNL